MNRWIQITAIAAAFMVLVLLMLLTDLGLFINLPGLLLVIGGTGLATWIAFDRRTILGAYGEVKGMNRAKHLDGPQITELFYRLARLQRTEGARPLEAAARESGNRFLILGVQLVVDETPPEEIRERLEQEFDFHLSRREANRAVLAFMGKLAPAMGLGGTIVGLIRMLHTISEPSGITEGMSVALLTTFYGLMLANLAVLPLERKLKEQARAEALEMMLITEGVMGLALEENGAAIRARLESYSFSRPQAEGLRLPRVGEVLDKARLGISLGRGKGQEA